MARYEIVGAKGKEAATASGRVELIQVERDGERRSMSAGEAAARALMGSDEFFVRADDGEELEVRAAPGVKGAGPGLRSEPDENGVDWLWRSKERTENG